MEDDWRRKLVRNRVYLVGTIYLEHLWNHLISKSIITSQVREDIMLNATHSLQVSRLLDYLERRPDKDYHNFLLALIETNQKHVADFLEDSGDRSTGRKAKLLHQEKDDGQAKLNISGFDSKKFEEAYRFLLSHLKRTIIESKPEEKIHESRYRTDYTHLGLIGKGGFGFVFKAKHKLSQVEYAVKRVVLKGDDSRILREVQQHANLTPMGVVGYKNSWTETSRDSLQREEDKILLPSDVWGRTWRETSEKSTTYLYIAMEMCHGGSLKDWLEETGENRSYTDCITYFRQIVSIVGQIHRAETMHRDLKPSNVFFADKDKKEKRIGDFGLATSIKETKPTSHTTRPAPSKHTADVGTFGYQSPEQVCSQDYDNKADIYALGVIFMEMFFFNPDSDDADFWTETSNVSIVEFQRRKPIHYEFVAPLLEKDAAKRPECGEIGKKIDELEGKLEIVSH